jgi:tetratricopeptide (TPR) repeat protein
MMTETNKPSTVAAAPRSKEGDRLVDEGRTFYRQGDMGKAQERLQQAYKVYQEQGNMNGLAETANDLGVLLTVLRRFSDAESWLRQAHRLFVEMQDYDGEAQTLGNLGSMYQSQGDLKEAAAHLQQAADRFHLVGDDERRADTLRALSIVRLRQFRFLQAVAAYDAALACNSNPTAFHRFLRRILSLPQRLLQR